MRARFRSLSSTTACSALCRSTVVVNSPSVPQHLQAKRTQVWCEVPLTIRWMCANSGCLSVNIAARGTCLKCGDNRPNLNGWECPKCKLVNGNKVRMCRGCASRFVMPKTWPCPACRCENEAKPMETKCSACNFNVRPSEENIVRPEEKQAKNTPHVKSVSVEEAMARVEQLRKREKELDEQESLLTGATPSGGGDSGAVAADGTGGLSWPAEPAQNGAEGAWGSTDAGGDAKSNSWGETADAQATTQAWGTAASNDAGAAEWSAEATPSATGTSWDGATSDQPKPDPISTKPPRSIDEYPDRIKFDGYEPQTITPQDPMAVLRSVDAAAAKAAGPAPVSSEVDLGPPGFDWMCRNVTCGTVNDGATDTCRTCLTKVSPSNWICEMCTGINYKLRAQCFVCKTAIPLSWQCSSCHKKTSVYDIVCRNCNAERPKMKPTLGKDGLPLVGSTKVRVSKIARTDWICLQCHKANHSRREACVKCEAPRPSLAPDPNNGHTYAVPIGDNNWTCKGCQATNFRTRNDCWQCGQVNPEGAASSGIDDSTTAPSIDEEGFQPEKARLETDEERNQKWVSEWSTGKGQSKIGDDAEWICATCMHRNFKENKDCHKCFTPKMVAEVSPLIHKPVEKVKVHKI